MKKSISIGRDVRVTQLFKFIFENHWEANETNICNQENTVDVRLNKKKNTSYFNFDYSANKLLKYYSWASV